MTRAFFNGFDFLGLMRFTKDMDMKFALSLLLLISFSMINSWIGRLEPNVIEFQKVDFHLEHKGWRGVELQMSPEVIQVIRPDMFVFRNYVRDGKTVNIYLGYYEGLDKSDLAHSPLVCYPGAGWDIKEKKGITVKVDGRDLGFTQLRLEKGHDAEMVIYGYRTGRLMTGSLTMARLHLVKRRILDGRSNSAFIRLSTPIVQGKEEAARSLLESFLEDFYVFIDRAFRN